MIAEEKKHLSEQTKVGSVLVVGAGIGGMQAALDLAEAGLKVYLAERSPAQQLRQAPRVTPPECRRCQSQSSLLKRQVPE